MQRQNIRLLALARSGDIPARCEVGRRYLLGWEGFPRNRASGIDYLSHPVVAAEPAATLIIAEFMRLDEIVQARLLGTLRRATEAGLGVALAKQGAWQLARHPTADEGPALLHAAARQGHAAAQAACAAMPDPQIDPGRVASLKAVLQAMEQQGLLDAQAVAGAAAREALCAGDLQAAGTALAVALELSDPVGDGLAELVVRVIEAAEAVGSVVAALPAAAVETVLEARACAGDAGAAFMLGRALCGIGLGRLPAQVVAQGQNIRKGAALLLRAADAGCDDAWMHLYRLHADHALSVANPPMARFFLEKAASRGVAEAQRLLGALILRSASTLQESEQALGWLYQAALGGDEHASQLQRSLVLPIEGDDDEAEAAIAAVAAHEPRLAARLSIAREFGLTKLEALCFDPVEGCRPWGLVVGKNPFISQIRLSAPRAIPALTPRARAQLHTVAELFAGTPRDEGDLRRRSLNLRRLFTKLGLDDSMFFAVASSTALESFRLGTKWAYRARQPLRVALAA